MMKVRVKKWYAIASWHWQTSDDSCGICRYPFEYCCANCKTAGDDCPIGKTNIILKQLATCYFDFLVAVWGQCSHCFHMHCILKWLQSQQVNQHCPMCRQEWKFKEV